MVNEKILKNGLSFSGYSTHFKIFKIRYVVVIFDEIEVSHYGSDGQ
jgi:hypothetical protein